MTIENYIDNINQRYKLGNATEHTFRGDLQQLIESLVPEVRATNEPKRQSCGAPDYILTKKDIPVGFIEAKDIGGKDLEGKKKSRNKEQFDRYKASLDNLIFTDYIDFHLYNDGEFIAKIAIAEVTEKGIIALPQNFARFKYTGKALIRSHEAFIWFSAITRKIMDSIFDPSVRNTLRLVLPLRKSRKNKNKKKKRGFGGLQ